MEASVSLISAHPVGEGKTAPQSPVGRWPVDTPEAVFTPSGTTRLPSPARPTHVLFPIPACRRALGRIPPRAVGLAVRATCHRLLKLKKLAGILVSCLAETCLWITGGLWSGLFRPMVSSRIDSLASLRKREKRWQTSHGWQPSLASSSPGEACLS